jgi:hypothetical protein
MPPDCAEQVDAVTRREAFKNSVRWRRTTRSWTRRRLRRETGGSSHRSDASNLLCLRPLNHGLSCFCCVCAGQEGDVPEFRRHRLAGKQADCDVFSEVCGHFYVAAGRWAAKRRLAELTVGGAVLTNCISCHNHHHSPVEATTSPDLGSILAGGERHARGHEDACGGRQVALATVLTPPALQPHDQLSMV